MDGPLGHTTGAPHDPEGQRQLLLDGLRAGHAIDEPGTIVDLPYRWHDDEWRADPLSWSRTRQDTGQTGVPAGDTRTSRSPQPQYQSDDDRTAAASVSWDDQCKVCLGLDRPGG